MKFSHTVAIAAPPEKVFALATDLDRWPTAIQGILRVEKLTDGPVGVGTRFKETRLMFGRECTEEMTFAAIDPPRSYTLEANSCGCIYRSTFKLQPTASGSELTMTFESQAQTFFAKLMQPLGMLMMGSMKKCITDDMNNLKAAVEGAG